MGSEEEGRNLQKECSERGEKKYREERGEECQEGRKINQEKKDRNCKKGRGWREKNYRNDGLGRKRETKREKQLQRG